MKKLFPLLLAVVFFATSCTFKEIELVEVNNFKIVEFTPENTQAEIVITFKNPNSFPISVSKADIDLKINGSDIGNVVLDKKIKFPKNSVSTQKFVVNGDYDKIQKNLIGNAFAIMLSKKLKISGKGFVKGKARFLGKKVKVDFDETMSLDDFDLGF